MKDDPIAVCPSCSGAVKRLLYPVGIVFKGSGWYVNDSRKPEPSESGSSDSDTKDAQSKPSESKTESNAESKGESKAESKSESSTEKKAEPAASTPAAK